MCPLFISPPWNSVNTKQWVINPQYCNRKKEKTKITENFGLGRALWGCVALPRAMHLPFVPCHCFCVGTAPSPGDSPVLLSALLHGESPKYCLDTAALGDLLRPGRSRIPGVALGSPSPVAMGQGWIGSILTLTLSRAQQGKSTELILPWDRAAQTPSLPCPLQQGGSGNSGCKTEQKVLEWTGGYHGQKSPVTESQSVPPPPFLCSGKGTGNQSKGLVCLWCASNTFIV